MAQIKIKRGSGVPAGLTHGELAYDVTNRRLYIGITGGSALLANTDGGVSSFNGLTGAVTGVTTGNANTFQALQSFAAGISASGGGTLSNGTYNFSGIKMNIVGGDEGGQIDFGVPSGSSLSGNVAFDIYQNKVRIFETGGTNRGVYIDLTGVSAGVGTNLIGGGGGAVSSVSGSGSGISVSPTTGAVVVQNTGVHSFNGLTGTVTGVTTGTANTFGPLQSFTNGISASGGTFSGTLRASTINPSSTTSVDINGGNGGINLNGNGTGIINILGNGAGVYIGENGGAGIAVDGYGGPVYIGDYAGNITGQYINVSSSDVNFTNMTLSSVSSLNLSNSEYIRNSTNGRVDIMPAPSGSTQYGMYFDMTSWGFGVIMGTVRSSDGAINTGGNFRFDVPVTINADTRFQLGSDGHYGFYRTDTGNNTAQIYALSNNANNSGAFALVSYFGVGNANRSPATSHTHPNFYIYANGTTSANDFIRFEHDNANGNIVSGGTTGILIQPGSGFLGISGGISAAGGTFSGTLNLNGQTFTNLVSSFNGSTGAVLADAVTWSVITADQTAAVNKGYFTNKATLLTLTLPTTAAVGSVIRVSGMNAGGWKIAQNASQIIHFGKTDTTTGTSGYLQNTLTRDSVEIICCVANNEWNVTSSVGNITIV